MSQKSEIFEFSKTKFGAKRARTFGAHQCIPLIQEMFFDYLISILAQKLVKVESDEILSKVEFLLKKIDFLKIFENEPTS